MPGFHHWHQSLTTSLSSPRQRDTYFVAGTAIGYDTGAAMNIRPNTIYALPFCSQRGGIVDRIAFNVNAKATAGGGGPRAQLGIYAVNCLTHPVPHQLAVSGSDTCVASNGMQTISTFWTLRPNALYWLAILSQASVQVDGLSYAQQWAIFGYHPTSADMPLGLLVRSHAYGLLPDVFSASVATLATSAGPALGVRYTRGY